MPAQRTDKKVKKVMRVNRDIQAGKVEKKKTAVDGKSKAHKKYEDAKRAVAEREAAKIKLQERLEKARSATDKAAVKEEMEKNEIELKQMDAEMRDAKAEEEKYTKDEQDAEMIDPNEEQEVTDNEDDDNPDKPRRSTESFDDTALITALLAGSALGNHPVPLDVSTGAGLSKYEKVIGYKNGLGKVGIICNTSVEGWPIYRIRRNVVIGDNVPNIIEDRRAGTWKNKEAGTKWGWSDALAVRGIAIAVPSGYSGNVEDLVVPVQKFSAVEKEAMKLAGKPIPKQPDVQALIEWKTPDKNNKVLSWESRTTSAALWKKATPVVLWEAAKHFEGYFRDGGGEDVAPFGMPNFGASLSPEVTPDPDQLPSTKTTPASSPQPPDSRKTPSNSTPSADKKAAARAEFKSDWCEEMGIDPEKMTDADRGSFMASFKVYWDKLNEKS